MADYVAKLKSDLIEQFRGKKNIEAFVEAVGEELQEVYDFFEELTNECDVNTAVGKQLDGIGDIVVLTRMDAGQLAGNPIPFPILDDETYRQYLIYKILKNTCDCTYPDIIRAFRMFWDYPIYYSEDPEQPATMIFDTGTLPGTVDTTPLFKTPTIRAAGVTLKLYAKTETELDTARVGIGAGLGYAVTVTFLPFLERCIDYGAKVYVGSDVQSISEDTLPGVERDYKFDFKLSLGSSVQRVTQDSLPHLEREMSFGSEIGSGSAVNSVMETPIGGITFQE